MKIKRLLLTFVVAASAALVTGRPAPAQDMQGQMMPGMMQGGMGQAPKGQGMMRGGMGSDMMCPMMRSSMMQGGGSMMGSGMMGSGMMSTGMMHGGAKSGMGALFGSRVTPIMNLSVDDVRGYLDLELKRLNNKRLKIGDLKSDDGTITADIVTVDNSLVQRLKVDRHTGAIDYEN